MRGLEEQNAPDQEKFLIGASKNYSLTPQNREAPVSYSFLNSVARYAVQNAL